MIDRKLTFVLVCLLTLLLISSSFAGDENDGKKRCAMGCIEGEIEVATITGMNYCFACGLKQEYGSASACKTYGHQHGLKVIKFVDGCGEDKPNYKGVTLHYLSNEKSQPLLKENHGETVEVKGKVYIKENVLEVESFKKIEAEKGDAE